MRLAAQEIFFSCKSIISFDNPKAEVICATSEAARRVGCMEALLEKLW